jgi:hypothetical protein
VSDKFEERRHKTFWEKPISHVVSVLGAAALTQAGAVLVQTGINKTEIEAAQQVASVEMSKLYLSEVRDLRETITMLRKQMSDKDTRINLMSIELTRLQIQIQSANGNPRENLVRVLDAFIERPAWAKECSIEKRICRGLHFNRAYQIRYGKTAKAYAGRTDVQMHGEELGSVYLANDLSILDDRTTKEVLEPVYDLTFGKRGMQLFVKAHSELTDGTHVIIGLQPDVTGFHEETLTP